MLSNHLIFCCPLLILPSVFPTGGHRTGKAVFIPVPKKGNAKECSNYCTIALISHASKCMLKILQARLQQYVNWELPDVEVECQRARRTRDQIGNICWIMEKAREFQKNMYFCFNDYTKAFDYVDHNSATKKQHKFVVHCWVQLFVTPWTVASQASLSFTISWSLLKLRFIESVMLSNHLICRPLLLLPSIFPSCRISSNELVLHIR